jgi:hypothetical protein
MRLMLYSEDEHVTGASILGVTREATTAVPFLHFPDPPSTSFAATTTAEAILPKQAISFSADSTAGRARPPSPLAGCGHISRLFPLHIHEGGECGSVSVDCADFVLGAALPSSGEWKQREEVKKIRRQRKHLCELLFLLSLRLIV